MSPAIGPAIIYYPGNIVFKAALASLYRHIRT